MKCSYKSSRRIILHMILRSPRRALFAVAVAGLAGCVGYFPAPDSRVTQLMPDDVARRIVAKYAGPNWAASPSLYKPSGCPEPRNVSIQYSDISLVYYMRVEGR